ncbi:hypothetical protein AMTR_s00009p00079670 [Amborella trichopoda]|uniref:Uncharacterized protein n=1 Tax=Amborella trichopoda TaxID=13333 RepID=W1NI08_AMBTC|nr:hypothetical protein AMTR_s00009p00079670 [Amborella trichopoda]
MEEAGCREMRRVGKIRMLWEESVKFWAEEEEQEGRGRIKMDLPSPGLNREKILSLPSSSPSCLQISWQYREIARTYDYKKYKRGHISQSSATASSNKAISLFY